MQLLILFIFYSIFVNADGTTVDDSCLDCICYASTGCDLSKKCHNDGPKAYFCGPFQISWAYWADGGKLGDKGGPHDFEKCLTNQQCSGATVRGYMKKWARDCNGDGRINCADFAAIHKAGPHNCNAQRLFDSEYWARFRSTNCANPDRRGPAFTRNNNNNNGNQPQGQPYNNNNNNNNNNYNGNPNHKRRENGINNPNFNNGANSGSLHSIDRHVHEVPKRNRKPVYPPRRNEPEFPKAPVNWMVFEEGDGVKPRSDSNPINPYPVVAYGPSSTDHDSYVVVEEPEPVREERRQPSTPRREERPQSPAPRIQPNHPEVGNGNKFVISSEEPVSDKCMFCICSSSTECDLNKKCEGAFCGPYLLSWAYWADAEKPGGEYVSCALDKSCSEEAIQNYMSKWQRDCNGDGLIDCEDFAAIHKLGADSCEKSASLINTEYWDKFQTCSGPDFTVGVSTRPLSRPRNNNGRTFTPATRGNVSPPSIPPAHRVSSLETPRPRTPSNPNSNNYDSNPWTPYDGNNNANDGSYPNNDRPPSQPLPPLPVSVPNFQPVDPEPVSRPRPTPPTRRRTRRPRLRAIPRPRPPTTAAPLITQPPRFVPPRPNPFVSPRLRGGRAFTDDDEPIRADIEPSCIDCICEASGCSQSSDCSLDGRGAQVCGPFKISLSYWSGAGKPGYRGAGGDFERCVQNRTCAEETVSKFIGGRISDCNNDGSTDCIDYAAIHKLGGGSCTSSSFLESKYWKAFERCHGFR